MFNTCTLWMSERWLEFATDKNSAQLYRSVTPGWRPNGQQCHYTSTSSANVQEIRIEEMGSACLVHSPMCSVPAVSTIRPMWRPAVSTHLYVAPLIWVFQFSSRCHLGDREGPCSTLKVSLHEICPALFSRTQKSAPPGLPTIPQICLHYTW